MTEFLLNKFVKNADAANDTGVREKVGFLSSVTGIVCNIMLFALKFIMGRIANSISIISDGFNNLSDCLSCVITLASYKLASQPADKEHPFGHGRIEYFSSLIIAVIIMIVGFEFTRTSFDKLLHPEKVSFSAVTLISLIASVLLKLWMSRFNNTLGTRYNSSTMLATSKDSLSDAIITSVTMVSIISSLFTDLPVDGIIGILVSLMILRAGYEIIRDTLDTLIGKPADKKTVEDIVSIAVSHPEVLGIHDLIVHDYGPGMILATFHAEVDSRSDIMETHDVIDNIEKEIYDQLHILATIHMDPLSFSEEVIQKQQIVKSVLESISPDLSMHDFRVVEGTTHTNLIFDILLPYDLKYDRHQLKQMIDDSLQKIDPKLRTVITFDSQF
ncbi:MAG: cation transporter [Erysipelotrichaceae bacterium]|nr:cation transporter [Erysipelotrichaceae bacterium]